MLMARSHMLRRPFAHDNAATPGAFGVRLPARQWGERVKTEFPGGLTVQNWTRRQSRNHGITVIYRANAAEARRTSVPSAPRRQTAPPAAWRGRLFLVLVDPTVGRGGVREVVGLARRLPLLRHLDPEAAGRRGDQPVGEIDHGGTYGIRDRDPSEVGRRRGRRTPSWWRPARRENPRAGARWPGCRSCQPSPWASRMQNGAEWAASNREILFGIGRAALSVAAEWVRSRTCKPVMDWGRVKIPSAWRRGAAAPWHGRKAFS